MNPELTACSYAPNSYLLVEDFTLTTTNPCETRTIDALNINANQFFVELPNGAIPGGPELISEGQTLGIPYVDTMIHSLHTHFPLCSGALTLFPDPRVYSPANWYPHFHY